MRAQNVYLESKLRSVEQLAEAAGRASEEHKRRCEQLLQENVRFKAENQALKAENEQLANFKHILMSAANGMAPAVAGAPRLAAEQQMHSQALSTADLDYRSSVAASAAPSHGSYAFSPLKPRPQESIAISALSQPTPHAASSLPFPHQTPYARRADYAHVMPSPLSADALSSPAPAPASAAPSTSPVGLGGSMANGTMGAGLSSAAAAKSHDILQEITANLSTRSEAEDKKFSTLARVSSRIPRIEGMTHSHCCLLFLGAISAVNAVRLTAPCAVPLAQAVASTTVASASGPLPPPLPPPSPPFLLPSVRRASSIKLALSSTPLRVDCRVALSASSCRWCSSCAPQAARPRPRLRLAAMRSRRCVPERRRF